MSQEVPILFRVKTDVQTSAVHYWSVWVMKSSDWCGAAGLSVRGNREWHDWPTDGLLSEKLRSSTSSANVSDEKGVSSSHPVSFLCELETLRGVLRALTVLLWTFILDGYHRWWHHQEAGVSLCPNTRFMSDRTSSALEYVSGTLHLWTKKMCPTSCLCRERHGNHARHPDEFKREEQQQKRKWEFWVPIETWQRLGLICSYVLYVQLLHVHRCTLLHSSDKLYWHQTAADQW